MEEFSLINRTLEDKFSSEVFLNGVGSVKKNDVHMWVINRVVCRDRNNYLEHFLSVDERNRAQKFRLSRDRDLFVMGRYITRVLLAHYSDSTPEKVKIVQDKLGKPSTDLSLYFNISHSHDQLLLGFSDSVIGVDIEMIDTFVNIESISKNHFSEKEFQMLMNSGDDKKFEKFYEIWTKKESLVKGVGKGLGMALQDFNVMNWKGKVKWYLPDEQPYGGWFVRELDSKQGYKSAFATQNPTVNLRHFNLNN